MPNLYIISGCNGAGKTTASFTVLPEMLDCDEFVNADEIAKGISPLNPDKAAIEAGRLMLNKINHFINKKIDFACETTLATKSYKNLIIKAKEKEYDIYLLFFWLESVELAIERVKNRVESGGHDIPILVIKRRYLTGIKNLFKIYMPICDNWMIFDNSTAPSNLIATGQMKNTINIENNRTFEIINKMSRDE